ncbi:hypothetical protein, no similarity [Geotrichum candidum]|uniref:Uncharacterized protein n=1 Tax=Geotrichum candidum TaxID=1173061 RepID=A0A0J9XDN3_GEOCN|nr:hypothetical protein, no similarity [Geotrichum candidum]
MEVARRLLLDLTARIFFKKTTTTTKQYIFLLDYYLGTRNMKKGLKGRESYKRALIDRKLEGIKIPFLFCCC